LGADLPSHIVIQAMGVDAEAFARPAPYAPTGKALQLFSCGRLNLVKGHQDLLAAVVRLRKAGRDVHLEIAGEDDDGGTGFRAVLEAKIIELGLQDHATLLGAIDAQTVRRKLWAADIFVLASWAEPLGVALMEAMVAGVPTIGTNAGGVAELITDGVDGLLARPADADDLAQTIARLADDPALAARLSAAGAARIRTDFHSARGAEALLKALDETLG
ncbi:MAG: glycosyltransferase, partial [Rhodobacteraceae bacterium]|nr:glycosyltransferase [Paracoccaceae bacterium]